MIALQEYIKDPCGELSIPYWKWKTFIIPDNMKIINHKNYNKEAWKGYDDKLYFRIIHYLKNIDQYKHNYKIRTVNGVIEVQLVEDMINACYTDISVTKEQILNWTRKEVYDDKLWIAIEDKATGEVLGLGIAEIDQEAKEGALEWIQVVQEHQGKGVGKVIVNELLMRLKGKVDFVTVSGEVDNKTKPENLYRKCGFTGENIWHILKKGEI